MAEMDLAAVMQGLADAVTEADFPGMEGRAYGWPLSTISPPAFVVGYPDGINMDTTMARGSDRATFPCWAVFGEVDKRTTRDVASPFITGVKNAIDGPRTDCWQSARVGTIAVETTPIGEIDFLTVRFDVDVLT